MSLADLGYPDAEERQTKLRSAHAINGVVARRRLTQLAAATKLGVNQPKVSALANYKLDGGFVTLTGMATLSWQCGKSDDDQLPWLPLTIRGHPARHPAILTLRAELLGCGRSSG
jgi:hypothetical protein